MRVLFLVPGGLSEQLRVLPAAAKVAETLKAQVQVACDPKAAGAWSLLPALEKVIPFSFDDGPSLADWANLLGNVREPDFQACINLAQGRQVDLMLSMSHIPNRVAAGGFSATSTVTAGSGWPPQAMAAFLRPLGIELDAAQFRLSLPKASLEKAAAAMPSGQGPALLLSPSGANQDWPADQWQALPAAIRSKLPDLRVMHASSGSLMERACQMANCDVVLSSDPLSNALALFSGMPLVAIGADPEALPQREGVQAVGQAGSLHSLEPGAVLQALGLG